MLKVFQECATIQDDADSQEDRDKKNEHSLD